jgi:hypothetical protein
MNAFPTSHTQLRGWIKGRLGFMAMLLVVTGTASGQTAKGSVAPKLQRCRFRGAR